MLVRLLGAHSCVYAHWRASMGILLLIFVLAGENHLSFIETSALDASNVELAFQNILTGTSPRSKPPATWARTYINDPTQKSTESYPARRSTAATVPRPRLVLAPTSRSASPPTMSRRRVESAVKFSSRTASQRFIGLGGGIPGVSFVPRRCSSHKERLEETRNRDTPFFDIRRRGYFGFPLFLFVMMVVWVDASNDRCDMVILRS